MLFFSYFKVLVGKEVTVELKNDLSIRDTLHSVDQYLNIKLENIRVVDQDKFPHMGICCAVCSFPLTALTSTFYMMPLGEKPVEADL